MTQHDVIEAKIQPSRYFGDVFNSICAQDLTSLSTHFVVTTSRVYVQHKSKDAEYIIVDF